MHKYIFIALLFLSSSLLFSLSDYQTDENKDGNTDKWVEVVDEYISCIKIDTNYDGNIDCLIKYNENYNKTYEELDFNHDGAMDDYYYYDNGVLKYRELDSNYDGKIDIWIYLTEGVYIEKYEWDRDFDGKIDLVKEFKMQDD